MSSPGADAATGMARVLNALRPRVCPVCATNDQAVEYAPQHVNVQQLDGFAFASRKLPEYMHWRLLRCQQCDLLFASPAPSPAALAELYRVADFGSAREAGLAADTYVSLVAPLLRSAPDFSVLDIGAGDGAFLQRIMQRGVTDVTGIEPSAAPLALALADVRPRLVQDVFRPDMFPEQRFDLITCFQTIEHVDDPAALCREAFRVLKPGGTLVLVSHNSRAWTARLMGRRSPIFDIEHLQIFCPRSLRQMAQNAGFATVRITPVWNCYPINYWWQLAPLPRALKQAGGSLLRATGAGRVPLKVSAGNVATFATRAANSAGKLSP